MGRKTLYVNKKFVFHAREATENTEALSQFGNMKVFKGEMILTDLYGNEIPETKELFEENYIQVEINEGELDTDAMAYRYATMTDWMTSNEEDSNYINDFQQKVRERNNKNN